MNFAHTHTHTHTHTHSNPLLWLTYLISLTMFSCNDDHFGAAPSGYPHQVIHISNTQGTSEQVSSPRGGGPDPKPQPNTLSPLCAHPAGALLWSRADARVGDESQGIAVKGLRCPLGYPRSDLGRLRMIAHRSGTMPRWPAPGTAGHSPVAR